MTVTMALGTMYFGTRVDERTSFALLDRFVSAGGTLIDTADNYSFWSSDSGHGGQSETVIGRWLAANPGVRDRVHLSTKVGAEPGRTGTWPGNREGLAAASVREGIKGSLDRLGTDRVDLYWAHMEDRSVPLEETVTALGELVDAGTVARLGVSNHPMWRVERARCIAAARGLAGYTALQLSYSYLQPRPLAPVVGNDHPGTARRLAVLDEVAAEQGATRNQVVLGWLAGGEPAVTPVVGVSTIDQLDEALAGVRLELAPEQRRRLDEAA